MQRTALLRTLAAAVLGGSTAVLGVAAPATPVMAAADPERPLHDVVAASGERIGGSYIVTFRDDVEPRGKARGLGVAPRHVYSAAVRGFAASLAPAQLEALRRSSDVVRIEEDQVVRATAVSAALGTEPVRPFATQYVANGGGLYGLDRVDQRNLPLSGSYTYNATASRVRAYVVDTGIATGHPDFGGRASNVYDALGSNGQDCNGHGTHVAGTIGGATNGLAKASLLRGVRVLGCDGSGSTSGIIAAVDWVRANAIKPAVANMSLGGGYSSALNSAVANLAGSGVSVAVAAGNESANSCNVSPASASGVVTVAAADKTDTRASFSNYGSCVEVYAPGVGVTSTWLSNGTRTISGTSMASPHVAGVMALYKADGDASSSAVNSWIVNNSTTGVVRSNVSGTPNRLLFKGGL